MTASIVPFYAAIFGFMFIALSLRVIGLRRTARVSLGHTGHISLERRVRVQANFAEYVPFALLLLLLLEMRLWPLWLIHALCLTLLLGRILHALGVSRDNEDYRLRVTGMAMTFAVLGLTSALLLASVTLI